MALLDDTGDGRDDEEDVADEGDGDGDANGLEAAPPSIRDVRAEQGDDVHPMHMQGVRKERRKPVTKNAPEGVKGTDTGRRTLAEAESASLFNIGASPRSGGKGLLDEVGL